MRYGLRLGCRWGQPHDLMQIHDTPTFKIEVCRLCRKRFRWNKGAKGRVNNPEYLKAHLRNYAQQGGATQRVYKRMYQPERLTIYI